MDPITRKKIVEKRILFIHFIALVVFLSQMIPAAWKKIIEFAPMMKGMSSYGYDSGITLIIGWVEMIGCIVLIFGIFRPILKNFMMILFLFIVVGAMATHLAVRDYVHIWPSIICIISAVIGLSTSGSFKILLNYKLKENKVD